MQYFTLEFKSLNEPNMFSPTNSNIDTFLRTVIHQYNVELGG